MSSQENSPILLETPVAETSVSPLGGLLGDTGVNRLTAKMNFACAALQFVVRDTNFTEFSRELLLAFMQALPCEAASLLEADSSASHLFFRVAAGRASDKITHFTVPFGQGVAGYVAQTRRPYLLDDSNGDADGKHLKTLDLSLGFETRNLAAVPVLIRGRTFGVVELINRVGAATFSSEDVEFLVELTALAAQAIEARLMISWAKRYAHPQTSADAAA